MRKLMVQELKGGSIILEKDISNLKFGSGVLDVKLSSESSDSISLPKDKIYELIVKEGNNIIFDKIGEFEDYVFTDEYRSFTTVKNETDEIGNVVGQTNVDRIEHSILSNNIKFKNVKDF